MSKKSHSNNQVGIKPLGSARKFIEDFEKASKQAWKSGSEEESLVVAYDFHRRAKEWLKANPHDAEADLNRLTKGNEMKNEEIAEKIVNDWLAALVVETSAIESDSKAKSAITAALDAKDRERLSAQLWFAEKTGVVQHERDTIKQNICEAIGLISGLLESEPLCGIEVTDARSFLSRPEIEALVASK